LSAAEVERLRPVGCITIHAGAGFGPARGQQWAAERGESAQGNFVTDPAVNLPEKSGTATSLLVRAAGQQADAWQKLVSLYGPLVYHWCRRFGLQPSDAENVGQEVFLRVAARLAEFRHDRPGDTFRGWLFRIARNCYVDHLRQLDAAATGVGGSEAHARLAQLAQETDDETDAALVRHDEALLYRRLVEFIRSEFSDRDWTAFYRVVIDGLSPAEAAAELKVSVNVVYLARSRVLKRVREEFAGLIPDES
jgi:RNA polymerase sigma-70 factor (ECF subfamily)